jgi:hypothetical protein
MSRLIVTATCAGASDTPLMLVSVSAAANGKPVSKLKTQHFNVRYLAVTYPGLSHLMASSTVTKVSEDPEGFYILDLAPPTKSLHVGPMPGYHWMVAVTSPQGDQGQTQVVYAGS